MAILRGLDGIEITICVDGQSLQEHIDDDFEAEQGEIGAYQASKTVSKYVEAITGKEFTIKLEVKAPYKIDCETLSFRIRVDGSKVSNRLLRKPNYRLSHWTDITTGIKHQHKGVSSRCSIKNFQFTEIETTTDESRLARVKDDIARVDGVGEISIRVYRMTKAIRMQKKRADLSLDLYLGEKVHEKALKRESKSHGTSLGAAQPSIPNSVYKTDFVDGEQYPIAIFRFKYRSREALKSLLIIERSPEAESAKEDTPPNAPAPTAVVDEGLTPSQKRKLEEFKKSLLAANENPSTSSEDGNNNHALRIKRENPDDVAVGRARKKPKYKTTIDLTEDDDEEAIRNAISLDD